MKKSLSIKVRDAKGRPSKALERIAEAMVKTMAAKLQLGQPLAAPAPVGPTMLTLHDAFEAYKDLKTGAWSTETRHRAAVIAAQPKLEKLLGKNTPLNQIVPSLVRGVWRTLAEQSAERKTEKGKGGRAAEMTVDALYIVAAWLRKYDDLGTYAAVLRPIQGWRADLTLDWTNTTGVDPSKTKYLTHSPEEMGRLFRTAESDPRVDIRMRLIMSIGGEQRLGQVSRVRRSQLILPDRDPDTPSGMPPAGIFRVVGAGKKFGETIALSPAQRAWLDRELDTGYLADLERQRLAGAISDYPLFPAGRFNKGRAVVRDDIEHITRDGLRGLFKDLEALAGVKTLAGRGWYGIRRKASTLARKVSTDPRVLDSMFANSDKVRQEIYEMDEDPELPQRVAEARTAYRGDLPTTDATASSPDEVGTLVGTDAKGTDPLGSEPFVTLDTATT